MSTPPRRAPAPLLLPADLNITWRDVACVGPLVVLSIWQIFFGWLTPLLLGSRPLLLSAIRGKVAAMIATGAMVHSGHVALWLAIVAPIPILMADDPFIYWAGHRYGRGLLHYMTAQNPRLGRRLPRVERLFARHSGLAIIVANFPVNPLPMTSIVMFLAGETRMRFGYFVACDVVSLIIFCGFYVGLGWFLGDSAQAVAGTISRYGLIFAGLIIVAVVVVTVRSFRRTMGQVREQLAEEERQAAEADAGEPESGGEQKPK